VADLTFRVAVPADVRPLLHFWGQSAEGTHRAADSFEAVDLLLARDPDALVVVADGQVLVGSLVIGWDGWRAHLYRLAVRADYRRRGIGSALLRLAEERIRTLGGSRIDAMVLDGNTSAQHLWAQSGYQAGRVVPLDQDPDAKISCYPVAGRVSSSPGPPPPLAIKQRWPRHW